MLGLAPFSFSKRFIIKEMGKPWVLYTVFILVSVSSSGLLCFVQLIKQSGLLATVVVSEFRMMCVAVVKAISSILVSVIANGLKSRKLISIILKVDKGLLPDSSATYRKTFIFALVQVILVYFYAVVLFACDFWVWRHALEKMSIWYFISGYPHRIVNFGNLIQFCDLVLLLRSRL
jgi:hypothetical protein